MHMLSTMRSSYSTSGYSAATSVAAARNKPSEYFRMHGHASFETDPVGIELLHRVGVENLLWGNDYPHIEGSWPNSEAAIASWSKNLLKGDLAKIVGLNAAKLFNIPVPAQFQVQAA